MNRNVESHFSELPQVEIQRSMFDRSSSHKTSFNCGDLIPFFLDEVLPGDTFNITTACVVRLQTPLNPIMDNIYLDTYYFYVPMRLLWTHWKEFMGENTESAWIPQTEYTIPKIKPPAEGWNVGTIADYLGVPPGIHDEDGKVLVYPSALPFRAYAMIADQWFRDQNLSDPLDIYLGDAVTEGSNASSPDMTSVPSGGYPFKAAKYHDLFSSSLPSPQKGVSVGIFPSSSSQSVGQLGAFNSHFAPVITRNAFIPDNGTPVVVNEIPTAFKSNMRRESTNGVLAATTNAYNDVNFSNLWADLSETGITINELRQAFQLQKFFEKNARAGTRYREILKEHFSIVSSDARMQIPEYLGGHRFPLSIHQVANTSQGSESFLGDLGAMSNTSDVHEDFTKSFEEHGYILGLCVARYDHSYPQGLERMWLRTGKLDFYWPVFANLGEQMVYTDEIYYQTHDTSDPLNRYNSVWGYQEAWYDYRFKQNRCSAEMRPGVENSLANWHLSDYYETTPHLSDSWIREDKNNVDRVLSVSSSVAHQVFADFYIKNICTRPMPVYSIPGLIDHH